jgi:ubiquinone/menaquinone biosynthesis C-methylase UbiE
VKRAENAVEYMDRALPAGDLAASLADVERLNARFGGHSLTLAEVERHAAEVPRDRALVVLDVGGGRGDLAIHLVRWARGAGRPIRVIVLDRDVVTVALGRRHCAAYPEIAFVQGDATALPLRDAAVDVTVTVLTLHHLEPDAATTALGEMRASARAALVVNDLLRTRVSWLLVWLATRFFARHPVSRHDGPLSVRRAYSVEELRVLTEKAGLTHVITRRFPWRARVLMVAS